MNDRLIDKYLSEGAKFTEFNKSGKYYMGWVAIGFRKSNNPGRDIMNGLTFGLNSKNDGWFRKTEGHANGYGLPLTSFKITSRSPVVLGDYYVYKAIGTYISFEDDETIERDNFWLFIHKDYELSDVLTYIEKNNKNWRP